MQTRPLIRDVLRIIVHTWAFALLAVLALPNAAIAQSNSVANASGGIEEPYVACCQVCSPLACSGCTSTANPPSCGPGQTVIGICEITGGIISCKLKENKAPKLTSTPGSNTARPAPSLTTASGDSEPQQAPDLTTATPPDDTPQQAPPTQPAIFEGCCGECGSSSGDKCLNIGCNTMSHKNCQKYGGTNANCYVENDKLTCTKDNPRTPGYTTIPPKKKPGLTSTPPVKKKATVTRTPKKKKIRKRKARPKKKARLKRKVRAKRKVKKTTVRRKRLRRRIDRR